MLQTSVAITYDGKHNPFLGFSAIMNQVELIYGYPVGNTPQNPKQLITTYHEKIDGTVNGKEINPGDSDTLEIGYVYNDYGFPIEIIVGDTIRLDYNCK